MGGKVGQVAGTVVGFVVGAAAGNPMVGASIGSNLGSMLDRAFGKKRDLNPGPGLDDGITLQTAHYGIGIKQVFGTYRIAGNIIWTDKIRLTEDDAQDARLTFAVALCRGPISGVLRWWVNGEEHVNLGVGNDGYRLYLGTEDQEADPRIALIEESFGNLPPPAYRGVAYIVFDNFHISGTGNAVPTLEFEVTTSGEEVVPYEDLGIVPEIDVPAQPLNDWAGTVVNALAFASRDYKETANGLVEQDSPTMLTISSAGNYLDVNVDVPGQVAEYSFSRPNSGGSLAGTDFGSNQVWVHLKFRRVLSPQGGVSCVLTMDGVARLMSLQWNADGTFSMLDHSDLVVATGSIVVPPDGSFHRLDIFHGPGTGITHYRLYIDGVLDIDSNATASTGQKRFVKLGPVWAGSACQYHIAEVVACIGAPLPLDEDYGVTRLAPFPSEFSVIQGGSWDHWHWDPDDLEWKPAAGPIPINSTLSATGFRDDYRPRTLLLDWLIPRGVQDPEGYWILKCQPLGDDASTGKIYAVKAHFVWAKDAGSISGGARLALTTDTTVEDGVTAIRTTGTPGAPTDGTFGGRSIITKFRPGTSDYFTVQGVGTVYPAARGTSPADLVGPTYDAQACFGSAYLVVVHSELGHDTEQERIDAEDNLVFQPPHQRRRVVMEQQGVWFIYNLIGKAITAEVHHRDDATQTPTIPVAGCDFDIDEAGYVYTTQASDESGGNAVPVRLNPDTLQVDRVGNFLIDDPTRVRVQQSSSTPVLAIIIEDGAAVAIMNRSTFRWGSDDYARVDAPDGFQFVSMDFENSPLGAPFRTVVLWMLADEIATAPSETKIVRIEVRDEPDTPTSTETDITANVDGIGPGAGVIYWAEDEEQVIVGRSSPELIAFFDVDETSYVVTFDSSVSTAGVMPSAPKSAWRRGFQGDRLVYAYGPSFIKQFDKVTKTVTKTWEVDDTGGQSEIPTWVGGSIYDDFGASVVTGCDLETTAYVRVYLDQALRQPVTLKEIVDAICEQAGVTSSLRDTSGLASTEVWGYVLANRMPARNAIEPLMEIYFFDGVEIDGQLAFPLRGSEAVVTIPEEDLAAYEENGERPQTFAMTRRQEQELPRLMELGYRDQDRRYQEAMARSFREFTISQSNPAYDTAVVLSSGEATQAVERMHRYQWLSRRRPVVSLPPKYLWLTPSDVVLVEAHGRVYPCRIDSMVISANAMLIAAELSLEAGVYVSTAGGIGTENEPTEDPPGDTLLVLLDVGLLQGADNSAGIYFAVLGFVDSWVGATLEISRDGGTSYQEWSSSAEQGKVGSAITALEDVASPWVWDRGNTVRVRMVAEGTLSSTTEANVMAGLNWAALGQEIIGFVTATEVETGVYDLSTLLRGLNGTEGFTGDHSSGDQFVLLHPDTVEFGGLELADREQDLRFRATSIGRSEEPGLPVDFTPVFRNLMPLSPQQVRSRRDGSNDVTIEWERRSRFRGNGEISYNYPLGEETEAYEIDILDAPGGTVLRTLSSSTTEAEYTSAQQTEDGFDPAEAIPIVVYQISAAVGRGYGTAFTIA